jgi:hypothetical protein
MPAATKPNEDDIAHEQSSSVTEIVELDDTPDVRDASPGAAIAMPLSIIQAAGRQIFDNLPFAAYITDVDGYLTYFNSASIDFSGRLPTIGRDRWCVSWKMFTWEGKVLLHEEGPMALALRNGTPARGTMIVAERPNGIRVAFMPSPTPLRDINGKLIGAFNMLVPVYSLPRWCADLRG